MESEPRQGGSILIARQVGCCREACYFASHFGSGPDHLPGITVRHRWQRSRVLIPTTREGTSLQHPVAPRGRSVDPTRGFRRPLSVPFKVIPRNLGMCRRRPRTTKITPTRSRAFASRWRQASSADVLVFGGQVKQGSNALQDSSATRPTRSGLTLARPRPRAALGMVRRKE